MIAYRFEPVIYLLPNLPTGFRGKKNPKRKETS